MPADVVHVGEEPVELEVLLPPAVPVAARLDEQHVRRASAQALDERARVADVMKRVEHRHEADLAGGRAGLGIAVLEPGVCETRTLGVLLRADDGLRAVVDADEAQVGAAPGELACDLAWSAAEIQDDAIGRQELRSEVGEAADRDVAGIREGERIEILRAVERLVERLVRGLRPGAPRPPQLADGASERLQYPAESRTLTHCAESGNGGSAPQPRVLDTTACSAPPPPPGRARARAPRPAPVMPQRC